MENDTNFETIINKWRRLSDAEQAEYRPPLLSTMPSMSGDPSNHEKKKEDESVLLVPEGSGHKPLAAAGTAAVVAPEPLPELGNTSPDDEKQEFIKRKGDSEKETAGDNDDSRRGDYGDNRPQTEKDKDKEAKSEKEKLQDNVDSVFLR